MGLLEGVKERGKDIWGMNFKAGFKVGRVKLKTRAVSGGTEVRR